MSKQEEKIKKMRAKGMKYAEIAKFFGVSWQYIQNVCLNQTYNKKHKFY